MGFERILTRRDIIRCVLCRDAPCDGACPHVKPSGFLRSVWFNNEEAAAGRLPDPLPCATCSAPCEKACVRPGEVSVREVMLRLRDEVLPERELPPEADEHRLASEICGIPIENPFLLSSSIVASTYDMCARAFEAGWAGVSFKTITTLEMDEASPRYAAIMGSTGTIMGFKNIEQLSEHSVEEDMEIFRRLKSEYPKKFLLASLMGKDEEEWERLARLCGENGADAVELNFSCPNMAEGGLGSDIGQVPELVERFTAAARRGTDVPILAKLTPNVASVVPAAEAARRGGADGISAINTIKSIMGVNPHTYVSAPSVHGMSAEGGYSGNAVRPIALRFLTELAREESLSGLHLSGMGGIEIWEDALEFILLGAGSVQVTTAVMQYGNRIIEDLKSGLNDYLAAKGVTLTELIGAGVSSVSPTTTTLERSTVVYPKFIRDRCIGCGRCSLSCRDGGHQAISMGEDRRPRVDGRKCVGCQLCVLICPQRAIRSSHRRLPKPAYR